MQKRLRFFYRYIIRSRRLRQFFTTQALMVAIVAVVVLAALSVTTPQEKANPQLAAAAQQALTPDPNAGPTRTPLPEEYLQNSQMTIGMTLGAAILVLIVVFGVMTYLPKNSD